MLEHHFLSPIPQTITTLEIRGYKLPQTYINFLKHHGAGYFTEPRIDTIEPTRYSLDFTLVNGLLGFQGNTQLISVMDSSLSPKETGLPDYFVPFFQDSALYYCFDYRDTPHEPSIRLVDTEMDQWLTIATSFQDMMDRLQPHVEDIDYDHRDWLSSHTLTQQLGLFNDANFNDLLEVLEDSDLSLTLQWLLEALQAHPNQAQTALERFAFLDEYRHEDIRSLPAYAALQALVYHY